MEKLPANLKDLIDYSKHGIMSKEILKSSTLNITLFCMAEGTEISEHTSTKEGTVYVIEGKGLFNLEGKDTTMSSGVLIHMNKNATHSLKAEKNTSFILTLF